MLYVIGKVDPKRKMEIGGYRLDTAGDANKKGVQLTKSETYLTELMENICKWKKFNFDRSERPIRRMITTCTLVFYSISCLYFNR